MKMYRTPLAFAAAATLAVGSADAAHVGSIYSATLSELNDSGVSGIATVTFNPDSLTMQFSATGLEIDQPHVMHIHGRFDGEGNPIDSVTPTPDADTDGDGFVEVAEGAPAYGPIILPFVQDNAAPFSTSTGVITFQQDVAEDSDQFAGDFEYEDLLPLDFREFVVHGLTVPAGVNDSLPNGGYLASLPVAAGEFVLIASPGDGGTPPNVIPTPSAVAGGLGLIGLIAARRRRRQEA